ncbi:MAG: DUF1376 domain-containing protein [Sedimentisphaerales bacterium]|nr:DUF1376 domain-containing protein [Sedimentisphaerales bacterium]
MKIKYVQLESDAFLTDLDFLQYSPAERGLYCSMIFYLNSNNGKCEFDASALSRLCNCKNIQEFEKLWEKVSKKFQCRNGVIKHKRVTRELKRAKTFRQACAKAGLRGANKRWGGHSEANRVAIAKGRKGNEIEKESKDNISNSNNQSLSSSNSLRADGSIQKKALEFIETLNRTIPPRSRSDRTSYSKVTRWLIAGCRDMKFNTEMFDHALKFAREAKNGDNPQALFMSLLKQLGYHPKKEYE